MWTEILSIGLLLLPLSILLDFDNIFLFIGIPYEVKHLYFILNSY